ncbi:MAG: ornithine cyclodeaminase family protein [Saccharolobus sp.]
MTLIIKEKDVVNLLDYKEVYDSLVNAFLLLENKRATNIERIRIPFGGNTLSIQASAMEGYIGYKAFIGGNFLIYIYDTNGNLLSIIESDRLTQIRTAMLPIIASDFIYGNYNSVGVIGLGKHGLASVETLNEVRKGIKIFVFTPSKERMEKSLSILKEEGIDVVPKESIKKICEESEVIITITKAKDPFLKLDYITNKRVHINAMGSTVPEKLEIYPEVIKAASIIAVEDINQSLKEAGELVIANKLNMLDYNKLVPISSIIFGKNSIAKEGITIFKSVGIGLEDLAVGKLVYEKALRKGLGIEIEVKGTWYRELGKK